MKFEERVKAKDEDQRPPMDGKVRECKRNAKAGPAVEQAEICVDDCTMCGLDRLGYGKIFFGTGNRNLSERNQSRIHGAKKARKTAYSHLFPAIPTYSRLFPLIPGYSRLFPHIGKLIFGREFGRTAEFAARGRGSSPPATAEERRNDRQLQMREIRGLVSRREFCPPAPPPGRSRFPRASGGNAAWWRVRARSCACAWPRRFRGSVRRRRVPRTRRR